MKKNYRGETLEEQRAYSRAAAKKHRIALREGRAKKQGSTTAEQRRERARELCRKYYRENPERSAARTKRYREKNPERIKRLNRAAVVRDYGLTLDQYEQMAATQMWCCAICYRPATECRSGCLAVDHNHITGKVRGLLCTQCNSALGQLQENQDILLHALVYLQEYADAA